MDTNNKMLEELVFGIQKIYLEYLISVVLYGSVARGTQTDESDVDIAVILKSGHTREMRDQLTDLIVDLELEYDKVISVLRIDYQKFREWEDVLPFYKNVKKEGIILWPAA